MRVGVEEGGMGGKKLRNLNEDMKDMTLGITGMLYLPGLHIILASHVKSVQILGSK